MIRYGRLVAGLAAFALGAGWASAQDAMSKDALFGVAETKESAPAVKIGGFFDALGAYTYPDPRHWSRGVGRLDVSAQGQFVPGVKWKVGGRVDADLVYFTSNFYLDEVKRDQRLTAIWGENYVDFEAGGWDFRIGSQQIVWGEVVGLFFADVVSARDMREFLLPSFDIIRIPQGAVRAEYFAGDSHLELVWIPVPAFDNIGKPGADFYPAPLPSPTPAADAALFQDPERPAAKLSNSNFGVRANTLLAGYDISAFYYRSFATQPTFYRVDSPGTAQPFVFAPRYDRLWQVGGTVSKDLGDLVLRGEAVYTSGQGFSVADVAAPQYVVERSTFDYIVSAEFPLPNDARLNVQAFQRVFNNGGGSDLAIRSDGFGASVFLTAKVGKFLEPQILWIQNFRDAGSLVRPRLNWLIGSNVTASFGVDIFSGPADGYFGRYGNRDRVYAEFRYAF